MKTTTYRCDLCGMEKQSHKLEHGAWRVSIGNHVIAGTDHWTDGVDDVCKDCREILKTMTEALWRGIRSLRPNPAVRIQLLGYSRAEKGS